MQLYYYVVSGIRAKGQAGEGQRQDCYWCKAYSDVQALAWAEKRCSPYLHSFVIESKEPCEG